MEDYKMIKFEDAQLFNILPFPLQSPEMLAFNVVLKKNMQKLQQYIKRCSMLATITSLPDRVLDLLAIELNCQYYEESLSRKEKEMIIMNTLSWYKRAGTASILEEFFSTIFKNGKIVEWFEYGGEPYFFRVMIDISDFIINQEKHKLVKQQIELYKNKRSWLEKIFYLIHTKYNIKINNNSAITFITQYYPRNNVSFLFLDGTWKLNGVYTLDGYKDNRALEFYPARLEILSIFQNQIKRESSLQIKTQTEKIKKNRQSRLKIQSNTEVADKEETGLMIKTDIDKTICYKEHLTIEKDLWFLDGTYLLDGTKLLDAEIIEQEL